MIKLTIIDGKYIDENGTEHKLPKIHLIPQAGVVIGFESESERDNFIASLPKVWDKYEYCIAVNEAHNALFQQLYTERDYLTIGEIPIWQNDAEYGSESIALQNWWANTCKLVSAYLETVTEETAQPIETFINSLPLLDN